MTDANNPISPLTPDEPLKDEPSKNSDESILDSQPTETSKVEPEISSTELETKKSELDVESSSPTGTVHVKVEPVEEPLVENEKPEAESESASNESEIQQPTESVEQTKVKPEIEKQEPVAEPETSPVNSTVEPTEPEIQKSVEQTKIESEFASNESEIQQPIDSVEQTKAEPEIVQSEVIAGAPSRPGDKIEKKTSAPNPSSKNLKNQEKQLKAGFKPDEVTPLDGEEKMFAAVGYISFLCFLPLLTRRDSEFAQHHARQATIIFIGFVFLWMIGGLLGSLWVLVFILNLVAIIGGFVLAYKGDWFKIPGIYDLSLKLKPVYSPPLVKSDQSSQDPDSQDSLVNENEIGEDGEEDE